MGQKLDYPNGVYHQMQLNQLTVLQKPEIIYKRMLPSESVPLIANAESPCGNIETRVYKADHFLINYFAADGQIKQLG
jgi:hypothetical protein